MSLEPTRFDIPQGWEPIARLCESVAEDADALVTRIVSRIFNEIPAYGPQSRVSEDEVREAVHGNLTMMLNGTAQRRGPLPDELAIRRELGLRRAQQGHPIDAVLGAYVIGYQELWNRLVDEPVAAEPETQALLLKATVTIWGWLQAITDSVRGEYHGEAQRRAALTTGRRERLMDAILAGELADEELPALAISLGLDAEATFTGIVAIIDAPDPNLPDRIRAVLRPQPGNTHAVLRGNRLLVLAQGAAPEDIVQTILAERPTATIAVGLARPGLPGAHLSLADAQRTLPVAASEGQPRHFEDAWLTATLLQSQEALAALLAPGIDATAAYPILAATVEAYADSGQSLTRAAAALSVHLNTVAYRLERWHEKTGWDPRTHQGLARSTAAIDIATHSTHAVITL